MNYLQSIMIVDDSSVDRFIIAKTIQKIDIPNQIIEAESGIEALKIIKAASEGSLTMPNLIFLDLNMPAVDGIDVLREIKQNHSHLLRKTRIVMISTVKNEEKKRITLSYPNVLDFLIKPISLAQISGLISQVGYTKAS